LLTPTLGEATPGVVLGKRGGSIREKDAEIFSHKETTQVKGKHVNINKLESWGNNEKSPGNMPALR
jgi:hypothetical protein